MDESTEIPAWELLSALIDRGDQKGLEHFLEGRPSRDVLHAISHLNPQQQERLFTLLTPESAADLVDELPEMHAVVLIEQLHPKDAAAIVTELPSDEQADILGELDKDDAEAILHHMSLEDAQEVRELAQYDDEVAGGLMVTEYLSYPESLSIGAVITDLGAHQEEYADYHVQYLYVTTEDKKLRGVLRMRDLLLRPKGTLLSEVMIREPLSVRDDSPLDDLQALFEDYAFFGFPVIDAEQHLVGLLRRRDVLEALAERSTSDHMKAQGILGGEELRSMPTGRRSFNRLSWLSVNIVLNIIAASVIAFFQDTLSAAITLAVFLPIISDMSGCSGNQAIAVSMRELSLGLTRPEELVRVWRKEIVVGVINGVLLGLLLAGAAWLWQGNPFLGLVVGIALALNTMIAVSLGGTIPLVLKYLKRDPALASGPVLTTVTDMCGFFLVLGMATLFLDRIAG